jgi:outer membrane protein insertion porin family
MRLGCDERTYPEANLFSGLFPYGFPVFMRWMRWGTCWSLVILLMLCSNKEQAHGQGTGLLIESIQVQGLQHIGPEAVLGKLSIREGAPFSQEAIRRNIQLIYSLGFFEAVEVVTEPHGNGVAVIFNVREKPFTVEVVYDGNDEISDEKLNEKNTVRTQVFLDKEQVKVSVERFRVLYEEKGYYHAKIVPIIDMIENNQSRVTFYIDEGKQAHIRKIEFEGRNVVKKKELLAGMANREYSWPWSVFSDAGILHRDELANDVERIKEVYLNRGYLDVQVGMPRVDLDEEREWFTLVFPIVEGEPYIVSEVIYSGNTVFTEEELREGLTIEVGEVFQRAKIRDEITRLTELYGSRGYAFAEALPNIEPDPPSRTTKIGFTIEEGEMVRIRDIRITGNNKTRDNVIRRELRVDERDMIDSPAIKRSFDRLNNLNFFETVEILPQQLAEGEVDLDVKVKEKPTGQFSIGGGFSTLDQFMAIADITEGNLFGRGYMLRIRGQLGGRRSLGILTFRNPAIFDSLTSLQADGFRTMTNFLTFFETKTGANLTFGRWFSEYISGSFSLVAEEIKIADVSGDAPQIILSQLGTQTTTGFRASLFRDSRDYFLDPRNGTRVGVRTSFGTDQLGGTNNFYTVSFDAMKFVPLPFYDFRYSIRGRVGIGQGFKGNELPVPEFFFVGGINTVRGFKFGRAGPVTESNTLGGATKQLIFNNDLIFPILPDAKLNGVLFFDYGKGFGPDESLNFNLRAATGLEVRWISPFGPLRAAYGLNLDRRPGEPATVFEFSVGSVF